MTWHVLPGEHAAYTTVPVPDALLEGVKHARNERVTVVRHDYHNWQKLRARGAVLQSPLAHYNWPGRWTPRDNQRATAEFLVQHGRCICLNGMRTGKTMSALWAADYLMTDNACRRVLVVAPLSTHETVWERAVVQHLMHRRVTLLRGDARRKRATAADTSQRIIVVNPDSLHLIMDSLPEVDLIIVDEATAFKNARSRRWKALKRAVDGTSARLWLMTAAPTPQSPEDAYGLIRLLHDHYISLVQWRELVMHKVTRFKWVPRDNADQTVARWLQPSIRFTLSDCGDVPRVQYEELPIPLSIQQHALTERLRVQAVAEFAENGNRVTADNAAALLSKILQVQSGGVYGHNAANERVTQSVQAPDFYAAIDEYVSEADTPVLIFVPFRAAAEAINDYLVKARHRVGLVTGDTKQRHTLFDAVQSGGLDALVAIPEALSHGITLDNASYVLWAAPPFKAESYHQANGRVLMAESNKKIVITHLVPSPIVKTLFGRLESKSRLQDAVLDLLGVQP